MHTRQAAIHGEVTFRAGDGATITIPEGPVSLDEAPDSVTLGWEADEDVVGSAALPRQQYEQYVKEGKIRVKGG